jgi:hypothetical protein
VKVQSGAMRTYTWMPLLPLVLGNDAMPCSSKKARTSSAVSCTSSQPYRHRVEVDAQLVGVLHVVAPRRPGVEVQAAVVGRPGDVGDVDRAHLGGAAPLGKVTVTVSIHGGRLSGTRFW